MISFALYKVNLLLQSSEYKVQMRIEEGYYDDSDVFDLSNNFMVAAAITGDFAPLYHIPPSIGELKFFSKSWNNEQ